MEHNFSLKQYNTFGITIYARYFSEFRSAEDLQYLVESVKQQQPVLILGGGSNILFTRDYDGLVLKNLVKGITVTGEDEQYIYIRAGAGENWHGLVLYCIENNLNGVENLSLIPGNVGASPMQNIGAYGVELKDVFYELEAFHVKEKCIIKFNNNECAFGYRESIFKKKYKDQFVILNVTFKLSKLPRYNISYGAIREELERSGVVEPGIKTISQAIIHIRQSKLPDPAKIGNAGSFFKNPEINNDELNRLKQIEAGIPVYKINDDKVKIPAGWLIEQCGWKGYRKGDAGCYQKQALVLVNYGQATGKEIYDLSEEIKISVRQKFNVDLEREVNII